MASVLELTMLSDAVYKTDRGLMAEDMPKGWKATTPYGSATAGFYAVRFDRDSDKETVVAIRGTDFGQAEDRQSDLELALGNVPAQYRQADEKLTPLLKEKGGRGFYVTGHSLGGGLASMIGARYRLPTVTFNAPGMRNSYRSLISPLLIPPGTPSLPNAPSKSEQQAAAVKKAEAEINAINTSHMLNIRASGDVVSIGTGPAIGPVENIVVAEHSPSTLVSVAGAILPGPLGTLVTGGGYAYSQHVIANVLKAVKGLPQYSRELNWLAAPVAASAVAPRTATPKIYTVVAGDSLAKIAQSFYNDANRWPTIYAVPANRNAIGTNPALIRPGLRLEIPI